MHRQIFSTIFSIFSLFVLGSFFALNALAFEQGEDEQSAAQDMKEFLEFKRFQQLRRAQDAQANTQAMEVPPPDSEIIIVPNPNPPRDFTPSPCNQSSAQITVQYQQSAAQVTSCAQSVAQVSQTAQSTAQVSSCAQSTLQSAQQSFCISNDEPITEEDTSSSSSSDDDSSFDGFIPTPTAQKTACNAQQSQCPTQILVENFYQHAKNKIKNNAPLENVRAHDVKLNGRKHSRFGRLGNLFTNWRGASWSNVSLTNAHIKHVRQSGSTMDQCEIYGEIEHSRYRGSYISNTTFSGDFTDVKFSKSELNNVTFQGEMHEGGAKLHNSFRKARLFGVNFMGRKKGDYMDLSHVNFSGAYFDDSVTFTNVDIDDAKCFKGAFANINGITWYINDDRREQIKKQFRHGKITGPVTMGEIMSKVSAPR